MRKNQEVSGTPVSRDDLEQLISQLRSEVDRPEVGIYGPDSQAWVISKESILFLGGGRAALLQLAHPYVAHAVDQHSDTRNDPLGRFQRTFFHVFAMVFGDLERAIKAARGVHNIHSKITGEIAEHVGAFEHGHRYEANQVEALLWVHATLIDTAVMMYELCVRPLSYAEKDRYWRETKRFAKLFGIPEDAMPDGWDDFAEYNQRMWESDVLTVGQPAREMKRFLFAAPTMVSKPLFAWVEVMTAGLMPDKLREQFGFSWTRRDRTIFRSSIALIRATYRFLPGRLRYTPAYVQATRRIAGKQGPDRFGQLLERLALAGISGGGSGKGSAKAKAAGPPSRAA